MSLTYPLINPLAFSVGPLHVHWYGLMYLLGFSLAWILAKWRVKHYHLPWTAVQIGDVIFYAAVGTVVGGRLGYMLFYNTSLLLHAPWSLFKIWEGGMSFHGGLIGVTVAAWLFARHSKKSFWTVADFITPLVPLGLAAGRIGNFINAELWGRVTTVPWAMVFPDTDGQARHPSQLYECALEGFLLFVVIWYYARKPRPVAAVSGVFLIGYAVCRLFVECFRQPDSQLGFLAFDWLTMGQLLSLPLLAVGFYVYYRAKHASLS